MKQFRTFILRGNVVDLAVGVVIGAAFAGVVTAFTTGVVSPLLGLFGDANFDSLDACLKGPCGVAADGSRTGSVLLYGSVLTALLAFLITAAVLFFFVVQPVNALMNRRRTEPDVDATTRDCPECLSSIPRAATRCAFCTVELASA